jgi:hypothetical protein
MARSLFNMVQPKYAMSSQEARALDAFKTGTVRPEYTGGGAAVQFDTASMPAPSETGGPSKVLLIGGVVAAVGVAAFLMLRKKGKRR